MNALLRFFWKQLWQSKGVGRFLWLLLLGGVGGGSWFGVGHVKQRFTHAEERRFHVQDNREQDYRGFHHAPEPAPRRPGFGNPLQHPEERREEHGSREGWHR